MLYARDVPPFSGDTHFANMYLAYETLSDTMRGLLDGLKCVFKGGVANYSRFQGMTAIEDAGNFVAVHPVVRTHPVTGRKALYLHRKNCDSLEGMSPKESAAILDFLHGHAENPDFSCRFHWRVNSIAMWDNRCALHRVSAGLFLFRTGLQPRTQAPPAGHPQGRSTVLIEGIGRRRVNGHRRRLYQPGI